MSEEKQFAPVPEQEDLYRELSRIVEIFKVSKGELRPHFMLSGASGSGKSFLIQALAAIAKVGFLEINAAQLTKEGVSGNSLSKALSPLRERAGKPTIVFVDEFDKLFISGNTNSELAHESTNGVQNEFLKILESETTSVFGDYGKYVEVPTNNVLYVFAGAFNGAENLTLDKLRDMGIKTEFLGRVGLIYNTTKISLPSMLNFLTESTLLDKYLSIFPDVEKQSVIDTLVPIVKDQYEENTLGLRMINTLITKYFVSEGKMTQGNTDEAPVLHRTLKFGAK
ncbi:putative ATP-dependent Clp protease [Proteus phage vB_PMC-PL1]